MPRGARRRTGGLRREEVAALSGMSADYYGRIEQRRGPAPERANARRTGPRAAGLTTTIRRSESRSPQASAASICSLGCGRAAARCGRSSRRTSRTGQRPPRGAARGCGGARHAASRRPRVERLAAGAEEVGELRAVPGDQPILLEPHPAGGLDALAGDPAHPVRRDRGDRGADVVGATDVAHRDDAAEPGPELFVITERAAAEVGAGGAGRDGVTVIRRGPSSWAR